MRRHRCTDWATNHDLIEFRVTINVDTLKDKISRHKMAQMDGLKLADCLICFTDGSCINNGKKNARAGYAVIWPFDCTLNVSKKLSDEPNTNNRAELHAVLCALRQADQIDPGKQRELVVYTDSELVVKTATQWLPGWIKNDFKTSKKQPVANQDLVKDLARRLGLRVRVRFEHVKAHTQANTFEARFNAEADRLAREAAEL